MQRRSQPTQNAPSILPISGKTGSSAPRFPAILLFGMPGVGKGTQGGLLGTMEGMFHCSTGDIFRRLDPASEDGQEVARLIDRGELVPDALTIRTWRHWLEEQVLGGRYRPTQDTLIMDGIPRNVDQCSILESHINVLAVIHLACTSDEAIIDRLRRRAITEGRADDADETIIRKRFEIYRNKTEPVLGYYPAETVHMVNPLGTPMEVKKRILERVIPAIRSFERAG